MCGFSLCCLKVLFPFCEGFVLSQTSPGTVRIQAASLETSWCFSGSLCHADVSQIVPVLPAPLPKTHFWVLRHLGECMAALLMAGVRRGDVTGQDDLTHYLKVISAFMFPSFFQAAALRGCVSVCLGASIKLRRKDYFEAKESR